MKQLLGFLIIIGGILAALFLGVIMLVYGIWDIFQNWETITFWQLFWDVIIIGIREIVATVVCWISIVVGGTLIAAPWSKKTKSKKYGLGKF